MSTDWKARNTRECMSENGTPRFLSPIPEDAFAYSLEREAKLYVKPFLKVEDDGADEVEVFMEKNIKLQTVLGHGSFGTTWHGLYLGDHARVKVLYRTESDTQPKTNKADDEAMFLDEARLIEEKRHTNIARLWHYCRHKKWFVFEYSANGTLHDFMENPAHRDIVQNWGKRLQWVTQIALAMYSAHEERPRILHRDLKTSNIFLTEHLDAKVGDFGLTRKIENSFQAAHEDMTNAAWFDQQAPEVVDEKKFSKKSDVYSYGVIMYELLLSKSPFTTLNSPNSDLSIDLHNNTNKAIHWKIPNRRRQLPGKWHPCLEKYITLMKECCSLDPNDRPHFSEISQRLQHISEEYEKVTTNWTSRSLFRIGKVVSILEHTSQFLIAATLTAFSIQQWSSKEEQRKRSNSD